MDPLMLVVVIVLVLWLMGAFVVPIGGSLIHLLLVIVLAVLLIRFLQSRSL